MNTYTTIIHDRNQLTLPQELSNILPWIKKNAPITIEANSTTNTITLQPTTQVKTQDWDNLWRQIHLVRSFKGQAKVTESTTEFLRRDRESGH